MKEVYDLRTIQGLADFLHDLNASYATRDMVTLILDDNTLRVDLFITEED